jgi:uncharacterized protein YkwD
MSAAVHLGMRCSVARSPDRGIGRGMRLAIFLVALGVLSLAPAAPTNAESTPEEQLLWLVNEERSEAGLPPFAVRDDVGGIAEYHSQDMSNRTALEHNDEYFTDATRDRLSARALGENVAYGPTIEAVHEELMASEPHRHNLLDPRFSVVGIGIVRGPDRWWVTQDFVQPR